MCGICGIYNINREPVKKNILQQMCDIMTHRGPDGEGIYVKDNLGLGMRRLSIIDLATGNQPIFNEDKSLVIVFNGEIYNYVELRNKLQSLGHRFSTTSDTEVIIHLFEEYGIFSFKMLNGFFAFALYDEKNKNLYLVRDRLGIKPIYYFYDSGGIVFASEIKAFKYSGKGFSLNYTALWDYFSFGYFPADEVILKGVNLLMPGYYLKISHTGKSKHEKYWQLEKKSEYKNISLREADEIYSQKIENAIKLSLRSDVPIGIFLSGGLDSNIILYEARKYLSGKITSYTIGFGEDMFDESVLVKKLAKEYNLDANFLTLKPEWIKQNFSKISYFNDSLAVTPAFMALYLLSKTAGEKLKVVLTGAGGDELLLGYPTYQADILWQYFHHLPPVIKRIAAAATKKIRHFPGRIGTDYKLKKFADGISYHFEKAHYSWRTVFTENEKEYLLSGNLFNAAKRDSFFSYEKAFADADKTWDYLSRASFADIKVWLTNLGHIQSDVFTMCNSLEMRPPLLENDLAEFLFSLPNSFKLRSFQTKYFFRNYYKNKIPSYILKQNKMGFHLPMAIWLKNELKDFAAGYLFSNDEAAVFFRRDQLAKIFNEHLNGKSDNSFKIFNIICFLEWLKQYGGMVKL